MTLLADPPAPPIALDPQPLASAQAVLEGLELWLGRLARDDDRLIWCSQALAHRLPGWRSGQTLTELDLECPGLAAALQAHRAGGAAAHPVTDRAGRALSLTLNRLPDGDLALQLTDPGAEAEAAARHLGDRERLLFLSRSLSVGEMASTLAHELNQPIGALVNLLRGIAKRLERGACDPALLTQAVSQGIEQATYAAGILSRVREYVQPRRPRREAIRLSTLVAAAIALLDWEIERDAVTVTLKDQLDPAGPAVTGDPVMLQQVIVNLARNAIEAMRAVPVGQRRLEVRTRVEDDAVLLQIADHGPGLDAEAARRLFTPFFTTKPDGTGLGLQVCRSIIELHGGRLWFEPGDDTGCTVCVALPIEAEGVPT